MDFKQRVAIITGGSRGLGAGYARFLAAQGATVVINSKSNACEEITAEINAAGHIAYAVPGDVADSDFCRHLIESTIKDHGQLDILINNAGIKPDRGLSIPFSSSQLYHLLDTDIKGSFDLCMAAWPHMVERRYGRILNTTSSSIFGPPAGFTYSLPHAVAKAGLLGLTRSIACEGAQFDIKANAVFPIDLNPFRSNNEKRPTGAGDGEAILRKVSDDNPDSLTKLSCGIAFLVHEEMPYNGEFFSVCNGRIARVFYGESEGYTPQEVTLENIKNSFEKVMNTERFFIPDAWKDMEFNLGIGSHKP